MLSPKDIQIQALKDEELIDDLPEFYELRNVFENNQWHHETTFEHVLMVLSEYEKFILENQIDFLNEKIDNHAKSDLLKVAILFHDISKKDTIQIAQDKTTSFPGHEEQGLLKAKEILKNFNLTENEINYITSVIGNHGRPHKILGNRITCDQELNDLKNDISEVYNETMMLAMLDTIGSKLKQNNEEEFNFRINKYKENLNFR